MTRSLPSSFSLTKTALERANRSSATNPRGEALMSKTKYAVIIGLGAVVLTGCGSNADTVSDNISKEAEKFKVGRRIVVTNSITDKAIYSVEGVCSFEVGSRRLDVICKDGPKKFYKATIGLGDNSTWASVQLGTIDVSQYRTKIILRPEALVPDFDLVTGEQEVAP